MAAITREVLNADAMSLTIFCGGQSTVGIGLTGTWAGTASFYGSTDGLTFFALSVTPFASGTAVSTATANANYFTPVKNLIAIKVTFTRTSGSLQVNLAAAVDSSWQDAFLSQATIFNSSTVTSGTNTLTQASQANRAWALQECGISCAGPGWAGSGRLTIYDGTVAGTVLWEEFIGSPPVVGSVGYVQKLTVPAGGIVNTPGNAMTIVLRGMGSSSSIINAKFSAA